MNIQIFTKQELVISVWKEGGIAAKFLVKKIIFQGAEKG